MRTSNRQFFLIIEKVLVTGTSRYTKMDGDKKLANDFSSKKKD